MQWTSDSNVRCNANTSHACHAPGKPGSRIKGRAHSCSARPSRQFFPAYGLRVMGGVMECVFCRRFKLRYGMLHGIRRTLLTFLLLVSFRLHSSPLSDYIPVSFRRHSNGRTRLTSLSLSLRPRVQAACSCSDRTAFGPVALDRMGDLISLEVPL